MGPRAAESRPEPSATGTLEKRPVTNLLIYARERALTGTLELSDEQAGAGIVVLDKGRAVKVSVDGAGGYLGSVAYELGFIDAATLDVTLAELSRVKKRHGELLLARNALTGEQLTAALEEQILRKLTHLYTMPPRAVFAFYNGFDALRGWPSDGPRVDPLPAVWRGVRDVAGREHVDAALRRLGDATWRLAPSAPVAFFAFDAETAALVDALREPSRVAGFLARAGRSRPRAECLLYVLALTKSIESVDVFVPRPPSGSARPPSGSARPPSGSARPPSGSARPPSGSARISSQSPSSLNASSSGTYARTISFELGTPRVPGISSRPPVSARSAPPEADPVPSRAEIALRASRIANESYYEMLGVERDASVEAIRAAFFRLSRVWRPERLDPELADVRALCAAVRARMEEAHRTLIDPEARSRYDVGGAPSSRPSFTRVDAESVFREAEIALARHDHVLAAELCKRARDLAPEHARYDAMLIWIDSLAIEGDGKDDYPALIARLDAVVRDDAVCESALFYRATFLKRIGHEDAAMRDFNRVCHINPKNIDAARELRLYNMRHKGKR
jgi:hypothetical protein